MRLTLSVLRCPASAVTETRSLDGGEISLGRGPDSDWVLADPDRHLSKRHCVLAFHGGGWQVADVSKNGTYLNSASQPLGQGRTSPLEDGDRLRLGDYEIEVRIAPAPATSPWADPAWRPERDVSAPTWGAPHRPGEAVAGASWQEDPFGRDPFQASRAATHENPDRRLRRRRERAWHQTPRRLRSDGAGAWARRRAGRMATANAGRPRPFARRGVPSRASGEQSAGRLGRSSHRYAYLWHAGVTAAAAGPTWSVRKRPASVRASHTATASPATSGSRSRTCRR